LPKKFVGGTLYDPKAKEVIIGADCALKDAQSGKLFTAQTDVFGDFWCHGLKDDRNYTWTLKVGSKTTTIDGIYTRCSTDEQAMGDFTTLDAQAHHCKNMLDAFGYVLSDFGKNLPVHSTGISVLMFA